MKNLSDSKFGLVAMLAYAIGSIALGTYSSMCEWEGCSLLFVVPIMPWAGMLAAFDLSFRAILYPVLILLNAGIAFCIGVGIEFAYQELRRTWKERHNAAAIEAERTTSHV